MRKLIYLLTAAAAISAVPAQAAIVVGSGGAYTVTGTSGGTINLSLDGFGGDPAAVIPGLTSTLSLTYLNLAGNTYTFSYALDNTSTAPITASAVTGFGFDSNATLSSPTSSGLYSNAHLGSNVPNIGTIDVCYNQGSSSSCAGAGSGSGGLAITGGVTTGNLTFTVASTPTGGLVLSNFYDRYQGIAGAGTVTSAVGRPSPGAVPEPATWALMLFGFGGMGVALRRRRHSQVRLTQIA